VASARGDRSARVPIGVATTCSVPGAGPAPVALPALDSWSGTDIVLLLALAPADRARRARHRFSFRPRHRAWNGRILAVLASGPTYASFIETDLRPRAARRARRGLLDRDGRADRAAGGSARGHHAAQCALAVRRRGAPAGRARRLPAAAEAGGAAAAERRPVHRRGLRARRAARRLLRRT